MATSGTVTTNTTYDSYFWVKWAYQSQSIAENKTTVSWSCGFVPGHRFYTNAVKMSAVAINGVTVYAGGTYSDITDYKERTFASGTLDIAHNSDGSKSFTVGAFSGQVYNGGYLTASAAAQSFELPTIPRVSSMLVDNGTLGSPLTISVSRASSAFTHKLYYSCGSVSWAGIASGVGTSASWTPPLSLAQQSPNSSSVAVTLHLETYYGSTYIGATHKTITCGMPGSMRPSLAGGWVTVSYDNSGTKASGIAAWVQGYSRAKATFDGSKVTCKYGASVRDYSISYLGKTAASPYRTETISATSATVRCTVTDSRGLSAYEDISVSLLSYAPPVLVGADLFRSDGECVAADSGTHIAGIAAARFSPLNGLNSVRLVGYWRGVGGSYGSGVAMTSGVKGLVTEGVEIAADRSYVAKLVATDSLGNTAVYEENIPTEKVAFHLREGGLGAAFGKAAEEDRVLELAEGWKLKIGGKNLADIIVEQGRSGAWTYRKWASGVAECWGIPSKSVTSSGTFLGANAYSTYFALPSGLFTSVDAANANPRVGSNYAIPAYIAASAAQINVDVLSNNSGTAEFSAHISVRGWWK